MKKITLVLFAVLLTAALTSANGSHQDEIAEGKAIVENGTDCSELSNEQLEAVGEYLMEQMHPNEAHEAMHEAMGIEEGTEQHNQIHISMAKAMYCGEGAMGCGAMMGNAGISSNNSGMMGMMGSGMMNMMGSGMMGSSGNSNMQGGMMGMMNMMSMMGNMGSNTMGMMGNAEHSNMHSGMDNAEHNQMHSSMGDAGHNHMHGSTGSGMTGMMPMANNTEHGNWMQGMMQAPVGSLGIGHWNLLKAIYMMFIGAGT